VRQRRSTWLPARKAGYSCGTAPDSHRLRLWPSASGPEGPLPRAMGATEEETTRGRAEGKGGGAGRERRGPRPATEHRSPRRTSTPHDQSFPCATEMGRLHSVGPRRLSVGSVLSRASTWSRPCSAVPSKRLRTGTPTCTSSRTWSPSPPWRAGTRPRPRDSLSIAVMSRPASSARAPNAGWKSPGGTTRSRRPRGCERRCKRSHCSNWRPSRWR
jgi:hypothetical protein